MRRRLPVLVLVLGAALALAGAALAGNGGFAPETPHSPNAGRINDSYKVIALFTGLILVLVEGTLVWFVVKYRRRGRSRTTEGPQIHGSTRLELIWTAVPVLILAAIAAFVFYKLPGIEDVPAAKAEGGPLVVKVDARQFYWQFTYPGGAVSIDKLHVPVNRTVRLDISSGDVVHSWWVPELGGKFDAVPHQTNTTWLKADKVGTFRGQCGEFCGVFHAEMEARVEATSQADYDAWIGQTAASELGRSEWTGVCAKCHGMRGEGGYGPDIRKNQLLVQPQGLRTILVEGQNQLDAIESYMPGVARGWNDAQFQALYGYLKDSIYKGAPVSGG